jgi:hypothetical protein
VPLRGRADLGIDFGGGTEDEEYEEPDEATLRGWEERLGLREGALDDGGSVDAGALLVHLVPRADGACARGIFRVWVGTESAIGIYDEVSERHALLEVDLSAPGSLRVISSELPEAEVRRGSIVGDLDGDGAEDELRWRETRELACFGSTFDTNECQGCGVPASEVVEVRSAGRVLLSIPYGGLVSEAAIDRDVDRLVRRTARTPLPACPARSRAWTGLRPRGAAVARRIEGGFAVDLAVERVRCEAYCVTPLGDVCTTEPDPDYEVSSDRCVSQGVLLETHRFVGGSVERTERALDATGAVATVTGEGCGDDRGPCSMRALGLSVGDGDAEPHRIALPFPELAPDETAPTLSLPPGVWAVELTRPGALPETWQVTLTAESTAVSLPR